ncbi:hypothetical protein SNE40_007374 [Patella caerulea]|uniref:Uncharacterized protein n=1 Tax=Patella caerulea TaxID=87958 RepID=A0AAN8PUW8_PATCE
MFSDDSIEPGDHLNKKFVLIKILQTLEDGDKLYSEPSHLSHLTSALDQPTKGDLLTEDSMDDTILVPSKRDFGVLPPWNEFCRMMRITHCFHSRQS